MPAKRARSKKAWSGRMAEATHPLVEAFTTSYPIDCRLYPYDIAGSSGRIARRIARMSWRVDRPGEYRTAAPGPAQWPREET